MKKLADGVALYKPFSLFEVTGEVESESTRAETEVRGEIPSNQGPFAGRIHSKTTRYQTVYLKSEDGAQHAIALVDFVIPCREGHKLTFRGADKRIWFDAENHTTSQSFEDNSGLVKYMFPDSIVFGGAALCGALIMLMALLSNGGDFGERFIVGLFGGGIVAAIVYGVLWVLGRAAASMRASTVKGRLRQALRAGHG